MFSSLESAQVIFKAPALAAELVSGNFSSYVIGETVKIAGDLHGEEHENAVSTLKELRILLVRRGFYAALSTA